MSEDYVIVDLVQGQESTNGDNPIYVTGKIISGGDTAKALKALEDHGLIGLTGPMGVHARMIAPSGDRIWEPFGTITGIYNIRDHEGRFGRKGAKLNVVAHGTGHPLSVSERVDVALGDIESAGGHKSGDFEWKVNLLKEEEIGLLAEEGTPIFNYPAFLEMSEDPGFLRTNPSFRIVRTKEVLEDTRHGFLTPQELYENSSVLCYVGGRSPVKVPTKYGGRITVTMAQAYIDKAMENNPIRVSTFEVALHDSEGGGRILKFDKSNLQINPRLHEVAGHGLRCAGVSRLAHRVVGVSPKIIELWRKKDDSNNEESLEERV